jgi:hypothetical protein
MMSRRGNSDDLTALLYLVPFAASGVYGLYLWIKSGVSAIPPSSVYLTVTRDPILFILGSLSVLLAVVLEVTWTDPPNRVGKIASVSNTLQSMALASLILAFIADLYANGFFDISNAATDFVVGRYALVFPAMLVLLSYLLRAQFRFKSLRSAKTLGIIALLLVPASLYALGKRNTALGLGLAFVLLLVGLVPFVWPAKKGKVKKENEPPP